jgi:hypothetical protein
VFELACPSDLISPSLGTICETVVPRERRNMNGSTLGVMHIQDVSLQILICAEARTTELSELPLWIESLLFLKTLSYTKFVSNFNIITFISLSINLYIAL